MKNARPHLAPGIPVLWRDAAHIQIGLHPLRSVIVDSDLGSALLELCDGQRTFDAIVRELVREGSNKEQCEELLTLMMRNRLMRDLLSNLAAPEGKELAEISRTDAPRILMQRELAHQNENSSQRHRTAVHIHGLGRLGMTITSALASAGFIHLRVHDSSRVTAQDVTTFGASRIDIGNRRDFVALQIIERVQAGVTSRNHAMKHKLPHELHVYVPDAVADYPWFDFALGQECMSRDLPHLVATVAHQSALVTSVITPGVTGCLRCLHLHNADHDRTWPLINAQLVGRTAPDLAPIGLVVQTALLVVETVTRWVDEGTTDQNQIMRFTWPSQRTGVMLNRPHPDCGCTWQQ
jgi:ThiF family